MATLNPGAVPKGNHAGLDFKLLDNRPCGQGRGGTVADAQRQSRRNHAATTVASPLTSARLAVARQYCVAATRAAYINYAGEHVASPPRTCLCEFGVEPRSRTAAGASCLFSYDLAFSASGDDLFFSRALVASIRHRGHSF
eukprot:9496545-Pyramimonas_sp.AAC.1